MSSHTDAMQELLTPQGKVTPEFCHYAGSVNVVAAVTSSLIIEHASLKE